MPLRERGGEGRQDDQGCSDRHAPPDEACKLIGNYGQAEIKMIKYVEANSPSAGFRRRSPSS